MAFQPARLGQRTFWVRTGALTALSASLLLGACADTTGLLGDAKTQLAANTPAEDTAASTGSTASPTGAVAQTELQKATVYWGQEFAKNPNDLKSALSYARNLKAMGERSKALSVLQQASVLHGANAELAGEYGRLALDMDQVKLAGKLLEVADNPTQPDWKVISARGTVLAKQGQYKDAIPYYERALTLQQNHPSLLNNLAMAYAMSGEPKKAEELLRQASSDTTGSPKVRQNLALVLGLQGKHDEARAVAAQDLSSDSATANAKFMRSMVKAEPKAATPKTAALAQKPPAATVATAAADPAPATGFATKVVKNNETAQLKPAAIDAASAASTWKTNVASSEPTASGATDSADFKGSAR